MMIVMEMACLVLSLIFTVHVSFSLLMCSSAIVIVMYTCCFSLFCFRSKLNNSDDLGRGKQAISFVALSHSRDNGSDDITVNALIMTTMIMVKLDGLSCFKFSIFELQ